MVLGFATRCRCAPPLRLLTAAGQSARFAGATAFAFVGGRSPLALAAPAPRCTEDTVEHRVEDRPVGFLFDERRSERFAEPGRFQTDRGYCTHGIEGFGDGHRYSGAAQRIDEGEKASLHSNAPGEKECLERSVLSAQRRCAAC